MSKSAWVLLILVTTSLASVCVTACGGNTSSKVAARTGGSSGEIVAQVGASPITRAAVNHWMTTLSGGDYYPLSHRNTIPEGLVSDPPNYARCVDRLEAVAADSPSSAPKLTGLQLLAKCRQLYQALKEQAVSYLVRAQWFIALNREVGVTATEGEVKQLYKQVKARLFPTETELQQYLTSRRTSLADILFGIKLDLLAQKAEKKIRSGGKQVRAIFSEAERQWTARTNCRPGYVVQYCKQYKGEATYSSSPPPSVLMEQVATIVTGRCINRPACAKQ